MGFLEALGAVFSASDPEAVNVEYSMYKSNAGINWESENRS